MSVLRSHEIDRYTTPDGIRWRLDIDRPLTFIASVEQIGVGYVTKADAKNIHNFFTYLLLGCNPATGWIKLHAFTEPTERLWTSEYMTLIKSVLNWTKPMSKSEKYAVLTNFARQVLALERTEDEPAREEELALTILMICLLNRADEEPYLMQDIVAIRACLDLYQRSKEVAIYHGITVEYHSDKHLNYARWLYDQLNRLLVRDIGFEELCREMAYLAWFVCLIRAKRMLLALGASQADEGISELLTHHVGEMYAYLNNTPLVVVSKEDGATDRLLNVYGVKQRKCHE